MKIITEKNCPPIPYRNIDWVAYEDGKEEDGVYGYGATKQEAIDELLNMLDD